MQFSRATVAIALVCAIGPALPDDTAPALPAAARNLDFEDPLGDGGWRVAFDGKAEPDTAVRHAGARSLRLSGAATRLPVERALVQAFDATQWRGRRVQLTGWVRMAKSRIGVWILAGGVQDVDREGKRMPAESEGWKRLAVRIDVPFDADSILIGARIYLEEGDPVWIDDLKLEACPEGVPLFDATLLHATLQNLDFELDPAGAATLPEWTFDVGEVGDPFDDDYEASVYTLKRDTEVHASGAASARLEKGKGAAGGAWVRQSIGAGPWRGRTVRFTARLRRGEQCKVPPDGPFVEVQCESSPLGEGELSWDEEKIQGWERATVTVAVPRDAQRITVGFRLERGTLWIDSAEFGEAK